MCIKSSNPEYFKTVLQNNYLKNIQFYCYKNSEVKKMYDDFFKDWAKSGIKQITSEQTQPTLNPMIVTKEQTPVKKTIDRSPEKLNKDLVVVKELINFMKDLLKSSTSNKDLLQEEFQQVYLNLVEMRVRVMKIVETLPPENILLKLIQVNDDLFDVISSFEEYQKTGKKREVVSESKKDVFGTNEIFKEENSTDELFSNLRSSNTTSQKYMDPIEKEFSNISLRKQEQPKVEDLFSEISNRNQPKVNNNSIDINKLFDNSPQQPQKTNSSQPSAPKEEDLELFGDIVNRKKDNSSNYDEFQKFLNNQKPSNPFE